MSLAAELKALREEVAKLRRRVTELEGRSLRIGGPPTPSAPLSPLPMTPMPAPTWAPDSPLDPFKPTCLYDPRTSAH